jgi:hypothetical protein
MLQVGANTFMVSCESPVLSRHAATRMKLCLLSALTQIVIHFTDLLIVGIMMMNVVIAVFLQV